MSEIHAVLAARELLENLTPLKTDCGRLCRGACCQGDEATGMLLFPSEEALYEGCAFARVVPTDFSLGGTPAQLLVCDGRCDRKNRPLACRLFPLFLKFREDQPPVLRMDARAREDYRALQGELFRANYMRPIHDWCRRNGVRFTGHLDIDHMTDGTLRQILTHNETWKKKCNDDKMPSRKG